MDTTTANVATNARILAALAALSELKGFKRDVALAHAKGGLGVHVDSGLTVEDVVSVLEMAAAYGKRPAA